MKITITNAYTWNNKGDAGILLGLIQTLKKIYGNNLEITILSLTPDLDKKQYLKDPVIKNVYSNILNPRPYTHTTIGKIKAVLKLIFQAIRLSFITRCNLNKAIKQYPSIESLSKSDLIIVCGGGFLGGKKLDSLLHVFQMHINTLFNKPLVIAGTSIEPFGNPIISHKTRKVIKKYDHVIAREEITERCLQTILNPKQFSMAPDLAFMLDDEPYVNTVIKDMRKKYTKLIGITVRNWHNTNMKNYIRAIIKTIDHYAAHNIGFVFVPQVIDPNGNDTKIALTIKHALKNPETLAIIDENLSPSQIKGLIKNFDYFVGTRMHSNIFATSLAIPTVAIAYEQKTNGIMSMLELDQYVLNINAISSRKLIEKIDLMMLNSKKISSHLHHIITSIKKDILSKYKTILPKYQKKKQMTFIFDTVLLKSEDNNYYGINLNYELFSDRYLPVFDKINVSTRLAKAKNIPKSHKPVNGKNVTVSPIQSYDKIPDLIFKRRRIKTELLKSINKSDRVIIRMPSPLSVLACKLCQRNHKPYALEMVACPWDGYNHHGNPMGRLVAPIMYFTTKRQCQKAEYVLYVTRDFLQKRYPTNGKTTNASNVLINSPSKNVLQKRLDKISTMRNSSIKIGVVGKLDLKSKGQAIAIRAIKQLVSKYPNIKLELLGVGNGKKLEQLARQLNLENNVIFKGSLPGGKPVLEWMDSLDVIVLPSYQEGLPRVLIEAMSRACPAVGSTAGGISELIRKDLLHKPGDSKKLAKDLDRILSNKKYMKELAKENFQNCQEYTKEKLDDRRKKFWKEFADEELIGP